jgi:hypothetical protein
MITDLLFYKLLWLALVWLCLILHMRWPTERTALGIVKLLGIIWSPGNRRYFPDVIATDPPFRRPALSPLFQPNSRIASASLGGTPARIADAV